MKTALDARLIFDALETQHPDADTELDFTTPFQLLVATILSAQSTDAGVNRVTPALFARYPDAAALAKATPEELEPQIHATGFFRQKARALLGMATALVDTHGGHVPADMQALTELPGVGRKTANVVLGHALGVPGFPVDRHVLRVSNRIGLAEGDDPIAVETELTGLMRSDRWTRASDTLILHGRRICKPTPLCSECAITRYCDYYQSAEQHASRHTAEPSAVARRPGTPTRRRAASPKTPVKKPATRVQKRPATRPVARKRR